MGLIHCMNCGNYYSDASSECPQCEWPISLTIEYCLYNFDDDDDDDDYEDYVVEVWKDNDMIEADYFYESRTYEGLRGLMRENMVGVGGTTPRTIYTLNKDGYISDIYELKLNSGVDNIRFWEWIKTKQIPKNTKLIDPESDCWELREIPSGIQRALPSGYSERIDFYDYYQIKEIYRSSEDDEDVELLVLQYIDGIDVWYESISEYRHNAKLEYWKDCDPYANMIGEVKSGDYPYRFYSTIPRGKFPVYSTFIKATQVSGDDLNDIIEQWTYEVNQYSRIENIHKEWLGIINREDVKHGKDMDKKRLKEYLLKIKAQGHDISILDLENIYDGEDLGELVGEGGEKNDKPKYHWTEFTLFKSGGKGAYGDGLLKYFRKDAKYPYATRRQYIEELYLYRKDSDNRTACFTRPYKESPAWEGCKDVFLAFCAEHRKDSPEDYFLEYYLDVTEPKEDWNESRRGRAKWGRFLGEANTKECDIWKWGPPVDMIDWIGFDERYEEYNRKNNNIQR